MRTAPPRMPTFESGRVTVRNADQGLAPRSRAASRWLRSMRSSAAKSGRAGGGGRAKGGGIGVGVERGEGGGEGGGAPPAEPVPRLAEHVGEHQDLVHP